MDFAIVKSQLSLNRCVGYLYDLIMCIGGNRLFQITQRLRDFRIGTSQWLSARLNTCYLFLCDQVVGIYASVNHAINGPDKSLSPVGCHAII